MERYHYSDEARTALERLQQPFAVYQVADGKISTLLVSDGFCRLLGYEKREQAVYDMDHNMYKDTHPDDKERIIEAAVRFMEGTGIYDVVFRTKSGIDSGYRVIHATGRHVNTENGIRIAHVWYMDEGVYVEGDESAATGMTRLLNSALHEESILKAVHYNELTGLPNLSYYFKLSEIRRASIISEGKQGIFLYMDLNGMKYFNHRNGFAEGDKLLISFSKVLSGIFGKDNCCHINADRFSANATEDELEEKIQELFRQVRQMNGGKTLPVMVGIYSTSMEDVPVGMAYDRAKMACDSIHRSDVSAFCYYDSKLQDSARRMRYIVENIDKAIAEKWIRVYYQPIVRTVNGRVCDEEALARWIDPVEGFLSPADFIPQLENAGLIYKLDLFVLEQVLEKIHFQKDAGLEIVPQSINLSRSDFDVCDMVEEIRKRVDLSGVGRDLITIEITESVIGSDFDFMRIQIDRFRELGFSVWMDDFGSGYSSLDVLQSIRFDLIKFDMSFMQKMDEGVSGKIILTDLMRMATSLGVDTVCEGVETQKQYHFLQEIGCSKLQGYFFCKPIPFKEIVERYEKNIQIGFEDARASSYFETISRLNLYDVDMITNMEEGSFQHTFSTIPMGIMEIRGGKVRFLRSNPSYRKFFRRYFGINVSESAKDFIKSDSAFMDSVIKICCGQSTRTIFDEKMADGSIVHSFVRRIGTNPVTGDSAVAVAVLSISEPGDIPAAADT